MNIITELKELLEQLDTDTVPYDVGFFNNGRQHGQPDEYILIAPLSDSDEFYDDSTFYEHQSARISLFSRGEYLTRKRQLTKILRDAGFGIESRQYVGFEKDARYHHYFIQVEKTYGVRGETP
jgi:hypothetical protein